MSMHVLVWFAWWVNVRLSKRNRRNWGRRAVVHFYNTIDVMRSCLSGLTSNKLYLAYLALRCLILWCDDLRTWMSSRSAGLHERDRREYATILDEIVEDAPLWNPAEPIHQPLGQHLKAYFQYEQSEQRRAAEAKEVLVMRELRLYYQQLRREFKAQSDALLQQSRKEKRQQAERELQFEQEQVQILIDMGIMDPPEADRGRRGNRSDSSSSRTSSTSSTSRARVDEKDEDYDPSQEPRYSTSRATRSRRRCNRADQAWLSMGICNHLGCWEDSRWSFKDYMLV